MIFSPRIIKSLFLLIILSAVGRYPLFASSPTQILRLASTTSLRDSGLPEVLFPPFEKEYSVRIELIALGSGQAFRLAERGDVDVIIVHDPEGENTFMVRGKGAQRQEFMYNDFVIVGPENDPAGIRHCRKVTEAFLRIADSGCFFISRGDDSGTHRREKSIWHQAKIIPSGNWYQETGQGMESTLRIADERRAYTLTDRGTFLCARRKNLSLVILFEGDENLFNGYSVVAVNPAINPRINFRLAQQFISYLLSPRAQHIIFSFGRDIYQEPLFYPIRKAGEEK